MNKLILQRTFLFITLLLLSFFSPWQVTATLLLAVALLMPAPVEYIFLVVGVFGTGIFAFVWLVVCTLGIIFRDRTRFNIF